MAEKPFEVHITLSANTEDALVKIVSWAKCKQMKFTHIMLSNGLHSSQPMITFWGGISLDYNLGFAESICQHITEMGCKVTRVKVEIASSDPTVPKDDSRIAIGETKYFEFHIKMGIPVTMEDTSHIEALIKPYGARLSRNARRVRTDNMQERFVTMRVYEHGETYANRKLQTLKDALYNKDFYIMEVESEYVIYDSNVNLDFGWIDIPAAMKPA